MLLNQKKSYQKFLRTLKKQIILKLSVELCLCFDLAFFNTNPVSIVKDSLQLNVDQNAQSEYKLEPRGFWSSVKKYAKAATSIVTAVGKPFGAFGNGFSNLAGAFGGHGGYGGYSSYGGYGKK